MKIIFDLTGCSTFSELKKTLNGYEIQIIDYEMNGIINRKTSEKLRCQLQTEVQNLIDELLNKNDNN